MIERYGMDEVERIRGLSGIDKKSKSDYHDFDPVSLGTPNDLPQDGLIETGNINLNIRAVLKNKDGSISTEQSITIGTDKGHVVIPTVVGGKKLNDKDAIAHFEASGEHLGIFGSAKQADLYARMLHQRQEEHYGPRRDFTRNAAVNFGTWITNDRGDGLALVVPVGTSYVHLQDADGDIYEIKFKDIPQYAKLASGKPQRFSRAGLMP